MKNSIFIFFVVLSFVMFASQKSSSNKVDNMIFKSELNESSIVSISVRDLSSGNVIYEKNSKLLLHPASTLKALTSAVILSELKKDYNIKTQLYKNGNNFYLKLSGDPLFTTENLSTLISSIKDKNADYSKSFLFFDKSILDATYWGIGWMWDDAENPLMPKFNAFNIDKNLSRKFIIAPDTNKIIEKFTPVNSLEVNFIKKLQTILVNNSINIDISANNVKTPQNSRLIAEHKSDIVSQLNNMNKNSDNLAAETLFKIMAFEKTGETGSTEAALKIFNDFYKSLGLDVSQILIVDASGVSHNNLISTDFISKALVRISKNDNFSTYKQTLATPLQHGTLENRLTGLKGNLYAKTGTIAGASGICGYLNTKQGKSVAFSILVQNYKGSSAKAKSLEDNIISSLYKNY